MLPSGIHLDIEVIRELEFLEIKIEHGDDGALYVHEEFQIFLLIPELSVYRIEHLEHGLYRRIELPGAQEP